MAHVSVCSKYDMRLMCAVLCVPAGLGEYKLRDLNDQINKLLREKGHWQRRIRELGGPNYGMSEPKVC
jgi:hypothetical protein